MNKLTREQEEELKQEWFSSIKLQIQELNNDLIEVSDFSPSIQKQELASSVFINHNFSITYNKKFKIWVSFYTSKWIKKSKLIIKECKVSKKNKNVVMNFENNSLNKTSFRLYENMNSIIHIWDQKTKQKNYYIFVTKMVNFSENDFQNDFFATSPQTFKKLLTALIDFKFN